MPESTDTHVVAAEARLNWSNRLDFDGKRIVLDRNPHTRGPLLLCFKIDLEGGSSPIVVGTFSEAVNFLRDSIGPERFLGQFHEAPSDADPLTIKAVEMREKDLDELPEWGGF